MLAWQKYSHTSGTAIEPLRTEAQANKTEITSNVTANQIAPATQLTQLISNKQENIVEKQLSFEREFTDSYIAHNTVWLLNELIKEFSAWSEKDIADALVNISSIKTILSKFKKYLYQNSANRILISTLELIFQNNNWEKLPKSQIKEFIKELQRFKNGEVKFESFKTFSQQLYRLGLSPLIKEEKN